MTQSEPLPGGASYRISGSLLEACQCGVLCPCWIGEDPDEGDCRAFLAFHIDVGLIDGVDVSELSVVQVVYIPGNMFVQGTWRVVRLIDERASSVQQALLLKLFRGELGGPLSQLASLVDVELAVEAVPVNHAVVGGKGRLTIPGVLESEIVPFRGPDGSVTTLRDSRLSTVPSSPAWVAKASEHRVNLPRYGMVWDFVDRNAIQIEWNPEHPGHESGLEVT
jgi:hypothetical protein